MHGFDEDLRQWGPENSVREPPSLAEAEAYCRRLALKHYENFPVLSWSLPRTQRQAFANIYAWCRWADDLADEVESPERSTQLLCWWRKQLTDCYAGDVKHPVLVALEPTIAQFKIPPQPFEDLISAFEQDQRVTHYETFTELHDYCRGSANPVGRLVLHVCGRHFSENLGWSDSVCTGLQLANFWQDVARDAEMGRVYLPREDCERFGYTAADLGQRIANQAFADLMRFQIERARGFLYAGLPLVGQMPGRLQLAIDLFARGGLRILDKADAIGFRLWEQRPVLGKLDVLALSCQCIARSLRRRADLLQRRLHPATDGAAPTP